MSKIPMNFRLEETLVEQLKKIADHENRSLTNLIETELKRIAENHSIIEQGKEKEKMNFGITANYNLKPNNNVRHRKKKLHISKKNQQ